MANVRQRLRYRTAGQPLYNPELVSASVGYRLLRGQDEAIKLLALALTAGLLIVAAVEDMMPEAHESASDSGWSAVCFIAGFCLFTLTSTYF